MRLRPFLFLALAAAAVLALRRDPPGPREGEATLDLSVYSDPVHDARAVDSVVHRSASPPERPPNFVVFGALGERAMTAHASSPAVAAI